MGFWITCQRHCAWLCKHSFLLFILLAHPLHAKEEQEGAPTSEADLSDEEIQRRKDLQTKPQGKSGKDNRFSEYVSRAPYFVLPTMRIPIIRKGAIYAYIFLQYEFKAGEGQWGHVKYFRHRLQNNLFIDLYGALAILWNGETDPDPDIIKKRVLFVSDATFGKGAIVDVYLRRISVEYLQKRTNPYKKAE